jgi:polyribonucleotide nucleotidyltransferase
MVEAIALGHAECRGLVRIQRALAEAGGKPRWAFDAAAHQDPTLESQVRSAAQSRVREAITIAEKTRRGQALSRIAEEVAAAVDPDGLRRSRVKEYLDRIEKDEVRRMVLDRGIRVDGRPAWETRPITAEAAFLPRAHGSALFTRGETQALVAATLGTKSDEQKIEALEGESFKPFMLHYNFPSFSVGEIRRFGSPGRREIGHGALAERSIQPVLPSRTTSPTRSGSSPTSSSRTAPRRWRRSAAPPWPSWTPGCPSGRRWPASPWGSSRRASGSPS